MRAALDNAPVIDLKAGPKPGFATHVKVELRKMVDTRAGFWLILSIGILCALVMIGILAFVDPKDMNFELFLAGMNTPMSILLPVLGILSVTSEWGQRTGLVTFTLQPRRATVVASKLTAGVVVAVGAVAVAMVLATIGTGIGVGLRGADDAWNLTATSAISWVAAQIIALVQGFAFGMLIMNTAAAIVSYFVYLFIVPTLFALLNEFVSWGDNISKWLDFGMAQGQLFGNNATGEDWAHFATSGFIWLLLPLMLGIWRLLRSEVK